MIAFFIIIIAALTAVTCALPGVFLVLRRMSLMSDAISHAILPGIVVAYILVQNRHSPLLILGAATMGLLMVLIIELLNRTRLIKEDAAIGLVFPALFSIGVILISQNLEDVVFHEHSVLVGDIALASLNQWQSGDFLLGPKAAYVMLALLVVNILFIVLFYKELKLSTFDEGLSSSFGFSPQLIHYLFMGVVSITAVGAFDVAGSILVIALMIAPASAAYLLTDKLKPMLLFSALIGLISAVAGFFLADWINSSPAGSMAMMTGLCFLIVYLLAPKRGLVWQIRRQKQQQLLFSQTILLVHLLHHGGTKDECHNCARNKLHQYIHWEKKQTDHIVERSIAMQLMENDKGILRLTDKGRQWADRSMAGFLPQT